jgi:AraC-like DNA-binding protein
VPRAKLTTFDTATKHLFRHLDEFEALQKNPIAAPLLSSWGVEPTEDGEQHAVRKLRDLVIEIAERRVDERSGNRNPRRLRLQCNIIRLHYGEGHSLSHIAKILGYSVKHCYRERGIACRQIAEQLQGSRTANVIVTAPEESFFFVLSRLLETDPAMPQAALEALQHLSNSVQLRYQKIAATLARTDLLTDAGAGGQARTEYQAARELFRGGDLEVPEAIRTLLRARLETSAFILSNHRGDAKVASRFASSALAYANRLPAVSTPYARSTRVEARFNNAVALWVSGALAEAYTSLEAASGECDSPGIGIGLRLQIQASLWKLRTYLLWSKSSGYNFDARIQGLTATFSLAWQSGCHGRAIEALLSLVECCVFARRGVAARIHARRAIALAGRFAGSAFQKRVSIDVGVRLLASSSWRSVVHSVLSEKDDPALGAYYSELIAYGRALAALRLQRYEAARRQSKKANSGTEISTMRAGWKTIEAVAAYRLGYSRPSREAASEVIEIAGRRGYTPSMIEAFTVASTIFSDDRLLRKATELAHIAAA